MSKKIKFIQPQEVEELPTPKCCHAIHSQTVEEKYSHLSVGKGERGLSKYYHYQITDEWVEIEKPHKDRHPSEDRYYLGLITILIDRETGKAVGKGTVSVNKLVQPLPAYDGDEVKQVYPFTNIPPYTECSESILEYVKKYLVGKCLFATGETFQAIRPDFSTGIPRYYSAYGEKLRETDSPYFEVVDKEGEQ